jgi:hypothetical protein
MSHSSLPAITGGSGPAENWRVNFSPFNETSKAAHNIKNKWSKLEVKVKQKHDKLGAACGLSRHRTESAEKFALQNSLEQAEKIAADDGLPQEARKRAGVLVEAAHKNLWGFCPNGCVDSRDEVTKRSVQSRVRKLVLARLKKEVLAINQFLQQRAQAAAARQLATVDATASGLANQMHSAERLSSIRDTSLQGLGSSLNNLMNNTNQKQAKLKEEYDGLSKQVVAQEVRLKQVVSAKRSKIEETRRQKAARVLATTEAERREVEGEKRRLQENMRREKYEQALAQKDADEKEFAAFGGAHGPVKEIDTFFSSKLFAVKKAETTFMRELPEKMHQRLLVREAEKQARRALDMSEYAQLQAVEEEATARLQGLDERQQKVLQSGSSMKKAMTGDVMAKRDSIDQQIARELHTLQTVRVAKTSEGDAADMKTGVLAAEATRVANAIAAREFEDALAKTMRTRQMESVQAWLQEEEGLDAIAVETMGQRLGQESTGLEQKEAALGRKKREHKQRKRQLEALLGEGGGEVERQVLSSLEQQELELGEGVKRQREVVRMWADGMRIATKFAEGCAAAREAVHTAAMAGVQSLKTKMVVKMGGVMQEEKDTLDVLETKLTKLKNELSDVCDIISKAPSVAEVDYPTRLREVHLTAEVKQLSAEEHQLQHGVAEGERKLPQVRREFQERLHSVMSDQQKVYCDRKKGCYAEVVAAFKKEREREREEQQEQQKKKSDEQAAEKSIFVGGGPVISAQSETPSEADSQKSIAGRAEKHAGTAYGDLRTEFWADAEDEVEKEMKSKARRKMSLLRRKMKAEAAAE